MAAKAIVIGSGPGGSTAAMVLAEAGYDVVIFEKGRNYFRDLTSPTPETLFANDELKAGIRPFEEPDPAAEPRTFRRTASEAASHVGPVNELPSTVGGGTVHWDAKTPRYWDIDFKKLSMLEPVEGADVQDWPFTYQEIAPYYDEIEELIGVQGDVGQLPDVTLEHAPRTNPFPMPPGPPQYSSIVAAQGASLLRLHPFPVPMAINSRSYQGRPACNNCGFCSQHGCPIHARVGALAPLRRALLAGAELRANAFVYRIDHRNGRATGVSYMDSAGGVKRSERADVVVLAGSPIESIRLALLSQIPDPNQQIGRYLMFHWFSTGFAIFLRERMHAYRGRSTSHAVDDFADPDFPGARAAAAAMGLRYFRGGALELGGTQHPISEAEIYRGTILPLVSPTKPFGRVFKQLMRASLLRDRFFGIEMIGEDLPQATNTVDLDPSVKDVRGFPVARITYAPHAHELAAQTFYLPLIAALLKASGADAAAAVPSTSSDLFPVAAGDIPDNKHIMGGMRMGIDPTTSVTNEDGRLHTLDNVLVADGSVFPTSGAHNPTLTIMATALRNARTLAGAKKPSVLGRKQTPEVLPATGVRGEAVAGAALIATAGGLAATLKRTAPPAPQDESR